MLMNRRFTRDLSNGIVGGVCSGLANYFGIDVRLIRVVVFALIFLGGTGLGIYLLMWILLPSY